MTSSRPRWDHWIDGTSYVEPSERLVDVRPASADEPVGRLSIAGPESVALAVSSSVQAQPAWADLSPRCRGEVLQAIARLIRESADELAALECAETGKREAVVRDEIEGAADYFGFYGDSIRSATSQTIEVGSDRHVFVQRVPYGVVGIITPWNYAVNQAARGAAPALAVGNAVVIKPSEHASSSIVALARLASRAGLPDGLLNVVLGAGATGAALVCAAGIGKVTFTGSVATGRRVAATAGERLVPATLELGGKSPHLVFADADLPTAAQDVADAVFANAGQTCSAGTRLLVEAGVHDEVVAHVVEAAQAHRPSRTGGPLITESQRRAVLEHLSVAEQQGARVALGGLAEQPAASAYLEPTVYVGVEPSMHVFREEVFGPVLTVTPFDTEDEALALANDTTYGLVAGLWTRDLDRAFRAAGSLRAGQVYVNGWGAPIEAPFGGVGDSGWGREKGLLARDEYTWARTVSLSLVRIIWYCHSMIGRALDGVRVVEVGVDRGVAFASRLLADLGADVVLIESAGDGPDDVTAEDEGLRQFLCWNKRSVAVELDDPTATSLLEAADIVMVGLPPPELRTLGLDRVSLGARLPDTVLTYVTPFGLEGPYADLAGSDLVLAAMSGLMAISGSSDREPLKHGLRTATYTAGLNAAYATVAALRARDRSGAGVVVDLATRDCLTSELVMNNALHAFTGVVQGRPAAIADPLDGHPIAGGEGYLSLQTSARQAIDRWVEFFDDDRLHEVGFATPELRIAHADALRRIIAEHLEGEPARDLFVRAAEQGLVLGFVQGAGELLECPHLEERGVFVDLPTRGRTWRLPAQLAALSATPSDVRRPAPEPGQHSAEVIGEWVGPGHQGKAATAGRRGPFHGLRVLDLSVIFAVPYLGGLMADLGAEVIKVEAPARIDQTRTDWGGYLDNDPAARPWDRSGTFHVVNRGKRSIGLDLGTDEGRRLLRELIDQSDVLLDNFTPRVMRGWGLTYPEVARINPRLVMLSNTGYGSSGPWSGFKAQGTTLEATMGLMAVTGYADGSPTRAGQSVPDFYACWAGLLAVGAALRHRDRTGEGQHIDVGMYQLGPSVLPEALIHHQVHGEDPPRRGARDLGSAFSDVVPAAGIDRWLAISAGTADQVRALRCVVGSDESLEGAVRRWSRQHDALDAMRLLQSRGVPAGPVLDAADLAEDPQLGARGFYESVDVPGADRPIRIVGRPYRWISSGSRVGVAGPGPAFGADNDVVLRELLGLDDAELAVLRSSGVVADEPRLPPPARPLDVAVLLATGSVSRLTGKTDTTTDATTTGGVRA